MLLRYLAAGLISTALTVAGAANSQDYPNKVIRIVAGSVGGGNDVLARLVAQGITGPMGQSVIVDNRGPGVIPIEHAAKTPQAIINRLNQEMVRVLRAPDIKEKILSTGTEVVAGAPEELAALIKSDMARMAKVIKDAGIKGD